MGDARGAVFADLVEDAFQIVQVTHRVQQSELPVVHHGYAG
jgi:hypothetical protein